MCPAAGPQAHQAAPNAFLRGGIGANVASILLAELDPARLILLDETGTPTTLTPLRGRSQRRRWEAVTLVATLRATGFGTGLQLAGTLDRDAFDAFVR